MILAHLCDEPKGLKTSMSMSLFYLPLAIANALTAWLNEGIPLVDDKWVFLGFCLYTGTLYLHFATSVIHEITTALGIYCFRKYQDHKKRGLRNVLVLYEGLRLVLPSSIPSNPMAETDVKIPTRFSDMTPLYSYCVFGATFTIRGGVFYTFVGKVTVYLFSVYFFCILFCSSLML